jgi:hypothetical protein
MSTDTVEWGTSLRYWVKKLQYVAQFRPKIPRITVLGVLPQYSNM